MKKLLEKGTVRFWKKIGISLILGVFVLGSAAPIAKALTAQELLDLLIALEIVPADKAELARKTLNSSNSSTISCGPFTRNLTIGSSGIDVSNLQTFLIEKNYLTMPSGVAKGHFGPLTRSALVKYQISEGISPAVGYFGPLTRANVEQKCSKKPDNSNTPDNSNGGLSGKAGSIQSYKLVSGLSNEQVGEGEDDVPVAGLEIKVDEGSDIEITAVKIDFDQLTASREFRKYADEVSIMFDGKEVGRVRADKFNSDNSFQTNISLSKKAVIKKGEKGEITVAVSGANNIDSGDVGKTWTVDFQLIRFKDAQGSTFSEDPSTTTKTFSFEDFATAKDAKLKISSADDEINNERIIDVDATNKTRNVELASYILKADGKSDLEIKKFGVNIDVTGADHVDDIIAGGSVPAIFLEIEGRKYGTASYFNDSDGVDVGQDEDVLFNKVNYKVKAGKSVTVVIKADILSVASDLDEGDTISVTLGETETDQTSLFSVEDGSGERLSDANITGSVLSGPHALFDSGLIVEFISANASAQNSTGNDNDTGIFTMVFEIKAFGGTVYVGKGATATTTTIGTGATTDAIIYSIYDSGTATTDDLTDLVTFTKPVGVTDTGSNIKVTEGSKTKVTLSVTQNNDSAEDDGIYYMSLKGIGWSLGDDTTYEYMYKFNLDKFQTNTIHLN